MKEAVEMVVKALVDDVEAVDVREVDQQGGTLIEVRVAPADMGKLIGRQGRTIRALRSLAYAVSLKRKHRFMLEIVGMNVPGEENPDDLIIVARAVRTRGLKGELVAEVLTDFPERFEKVSELSGVGPGGERAQLKLESYWFQNDRMVLKFTGYDTIESAKALVGYEFGLPEAERIELPKDEFYDWELEGCSVESNLGLSVGKVREVLRTGGVELLVVENEERREVFVPMAAAIVIEIDIAHKKIVIDPPEGLLDL